MYCEDFIDITAEADKFINIGLLQDMGDSPGDVGEVPVT